MKAMNFCYTLQIIQLFFIYVSGNGEGEPLPIIIKNGTFQIAHPEWIKSRDDIDYYEFRYALPLAPWNQINLFCSPDSSHFPSSSATALKFAIENRNTESFFKCGNKPIPIVVKVLNAEKIYKNWNPDIEWYVSGYKFDAQPIIERIKIPKEIFQSEIQYESLNEYEEIVSGYSVFYNKTIGQMIAAKYELLSADLYEPDSKDIYPKQYRKEITPNMSKIFEHMEVVKVFKDKKPGEEEFFEWLKQDSLISPPHFIHNLRKRMTWTNVNRIPIWDKFFRQHKNINKFLEIVAMKIGKLQITSGVSGFGSTSEEREQRTYTNRQNNSKVIVSDFIWKVVEFKHKNQMYGIILVLVNTLSESQNKICEEDVCAKYKWSLQFKDEENIVYCCNMTSQAIRNLEVPFLQLKERQEFNLESWGFAT